MLKDGLFADRLNVVKEGKEPPVIIKENHQPIQYNNTVNDIVISPWITFLAELYKLCELIGMSILYGIGIKAIFSTNWTFWGIFGVGLLVNKGINLLSRLKFFK